MDSNLIERIQEENSKLKELLSLALGGLHGNCAVCTNYSENHNQGKCGSCCYEPVKNNSKELQDNWQWCKDGKKQDSAKEEKAVQRKMKRAIEFEERVVIYHRVVVECEDEASIDNICDLTGDCFEDIVSEIDDMSESGVNVLEVSEKFLENIDGAVEYHDDYWTESEKERYGN